MTSICWLHRFEYDLPLHCFPLPRIDQLVDAIIGHLLLSFIDANSVYNQIKMHQPNQEHTSFIIDRSLYYYTVMPFRFKKARAMYQQLVNQMFL